MKSAGLTVIGIAQLRSAPVGVYPEFMPPSVEIQTEALGLSAAEVEQLAREYAATKPAAIRMNYGVQRSENGGTAARGVPMKTMRINGWGGDCPRPFNSLSRPLQPVKRASRHKACPYNSITANCLNSRAGFGLLAGRSPNPDRRNLRLHEQQQIVAAACL